jgi:uncharacterized protein YfaQ (DUF2300 family)
MECRLFESGSERVILGAATVLWLAHSWHLKRQLTKAREKLELVLEQFPGIREWLRRNHG